MEKPINLKLNLTQLTILEVLVCRFRKDLSTHLNKLQEGDLDTLTDFVIKHETEEDRHQYLKSLVIQDIATEDLLTEIRKIHESCESNLGPN